MVDTDHSEEIDRRRIIRRLGIGGFLLLSFAALGVVVSVTYVGNERQRALQDWQVQLSIVADSRVAAIEEWLQHSFDVIDDLTENQTLQLYVSELAAADWDRSKVVDEAAQAGYLRNLLDATAERSGFAAPTAASSLLSNVSQPSFVGLGLVTGEDHRIGVRTQVLPEIIGPIKKAVKQTRNGKKTFIDMYLSEAGPPVIGFASPVYGLQDDPDGIGIGVVLGVREVDPELFKRLKQPGETTKTSETYLIRSSGTQIEYLSPLAGGIAPLSRSLALNTANLAAAAAVSSPGEFGQFVDYKGDNVLVVSRLISNTPWILLRTISATEALAEVDRRLKTVLTVLVLLIVGITVTIIAVWRHGTSVRAAEAAARFRVAADRFQNISKFMKLVTDSQPTEIVAIDQEGRFTFANGTAAEKAGISSEDMIGKSMASVVGPIKAGEYAGINARVLADDKPEITIREFDDGEGGKTVVRSHHIPLKGDRDHPPATLMVLDDITELNQEREKSQERLQQLVDTLVDIVDRRDTFSAHHSSRVTDVAMAICDEMGRPAEEKQTTSFAAKLMNIGKIFVPTGILTKTTPLSEEERTMLGRSTQAGVELLHGVEFEGPVTDILQELAEKWDANGKFTCDAEEISLPARIIHLANTFVGMVSPRAYRDGIPIETAMEILMGEAGSKQDRGIVLALANYVENKGGQEQWSHFNTPKEGEVEAYLWHTPSDTDQE